MPLDDNPLLKVMAEQLLEERQLWTHKIEQVRADSKALRSLVVVMNENVAGVRSEMLRKGEETYELLFSQLSDRFDVDLAKVRASDAAALMTRIQMYDGLVEQVRTVLATIRDGKPGEPGERGEKGATGATGEVGERGPKGERGEKGDTGPLPPAQLLADLINENQSIVEVQKLLTDTAESVMRQYQESHDALNARLATLKDGERGMRGEKGDRGLPGPRGEKGEIGDRGPVGERGEIGPIGAKGDKGERGDVGDRGPQGPEGLQGEHGIDGQHGTKGDKGEKGDRGEQGYAGIQGITGAKGDTGDQGPEGPIGDKGDPGEKGDRGEQGEKGFTGEKGDQGDTGPEGPVGAKGETGEQGPEGPVGPTGPMGEPGTPGSKGEPGVDRVRLLSNARRMEPGSKVERNELVVHDGAIFHAARSVEGTPDEEPAAYNLMFRSPELRVVSNVAAGELIFEVQRIDGGFDTVRHHMLRVCGVWKAEEEYDYLNVVVYRRQTWARNEKGNDGKSPSESEAWTLLAEAGQRGSKGEAGPRGHDGLPGRDGDPGAPGKDGVGIKDIILSNDVFYVELENGTEKAWPIEKVFPDDGDNPPLNKFVGLYEDGKSYRRGDVVNFMNGAHVANTTTQQDPLSDDWDVILRAPLTSGGAVVDGGGGGGEGGPVAWVDITGKPSTFPPSTHVHAYDSLTGIPSTFPAAPHTHAYNTLTGIPTTFAPAAHTHAWTEVTGKPATFPPSTHTHLWADISNPPSTFPSDWSTIANKPATFVGDWNTLTNKPSTFAPTAHTHDYTTGITGKPSTFPPSTHTHLWADITDKPTTFAPSAHNHIWSNITGVPSTVTSTGIPDAGKIVLLNSVGKIDLSMLDPTLLTIDGGTY